MNKVLVLFIITFFSLNLYSQDDEEGVFKLLNDSILKDPYNSELLTYRGMAYLETKDYDKALKDYTSALKGLEEFINKRKFSEDFVNGHPIDSTIILQFRADCYNKLGLIKEAVADYSLLLLRNPKDFYYPIAISQVYIKNKLYNDAQMEIDKLRSNSETNEMGFVQQARLYISQEKFDDALSIINSTLIKYPGSLRALMTKSTIFEKLNKKNDACKSVEEAKSKISLDYFKGSEEQMFGFEREIKDLIEKYCN